MPPGDTIRTLLMARRAQVLRAMHLVPGPMGLEPERIGMDRSVLRP